jgi:hypothetical protein
MHNQNDAPPLHVVHSRYDELINHYITEFSDIFFHTNKSEEWFQDRYHPCKLAQVEKDAEAWAVSSSKELLESIVKAPAHIISACNLDPPDWLHADNNNRGNKKQKVVEKVIEVTAITFGGGERDPNGPISIVGIGQVAGEVAASDQAGFVDKLATVIQILGSLNFALFVFNMIPLLPLDGGHVAGGIYESIKRGLYRIAGRKDPGPADTALLMPLTYFVFIALLVVSVLLITADLVNPISLFG